MNAIEELYFIVGRLEGLLFKSIIKPQDIFFIEGIIENNRYLNAEKIPMEDNEDFFYDEQKFDYKHPFESRYYNDNLDMDQQSQEFWDDL
jgi:hypothetical protein